MYCLTRTVFKNYKEELIVSNSTEIVHMLSMLTGFTVKKMTSLKIMIFKLCKERHG